MKIKTCGNCAQQRKTKLNYLEDGRPPKYYVWLCASYFGATKRNGEDICGGYIQKPLKPIKQVDE
jgi:hypothetical protein